MFWDDDVPLFFVDFGEPFVFSNPADVTISVIVDMASQRVTLGKAQQLFADLPLPQVLAMDTDIATHQIVEGSYGTLRGKVWRVSKLLPTGDGLTAIALGDKQEAETTGHERTWR